MLQGRKQRLWRGNLALFAFLLQLVLSTGHMHPEDLFGPQGYPVVAGHGVDALEADRGDRGNQSPSDPVSGADVDGCAICAAMHMVAASVPPLPFLLHRQLELYAVLAPSLQRKLSTSPDYRLFQSRAPPLSV